MDFGEYKVFTEVTKKGSAVCPQVSKPLIPPQPITSKNYSASANIPLHSDICPDFYNYISKFSGGSSVPIQFKKWL